jgi:hypothetical protein
MPYFSEVKNYVLVLPSTYILTTDNEWDEREFVLSHKDIYINKIGQHAASPSSTVLDVVKLDFERLADYIRFEALKKKHIISIDRIKEILSV